MRQTSVGRPASWLPLEISRLGRNSYFPRSWIIMTIALAALGTYNVFTYLSTRPPTMVLASGPFLLQINTTAPIFALSLGILSWVLWALFDKRTGRMREQAFSFLLNVVEAFFFALTWGALLRSVWMFLST